MTRRRSPVAVPAPMGDSSVATAPSEPFLNVVPLTGWRRPSLAPVLALPTGCIILLRRPPLNGFDFH